MKLFALTVATLMVAGASFAQAEMLTFKADLTAASEVPPATDSKGSGMATVTVDTDTKKVSWEVTSKDLTGDATAAHIHGPAAAGENAPPMIDISANIAKGSGDITDAQLADLQAGRTYLNIHTMKYPDGEIRGQLMK
ncbi:MAG: CHRD domain-containing protein [Rhizobiales bacterium]|nr:CHRD domain-containing protein [Hyphomicrobiales bacterium]